MTNETKSMNATLSRVNISLSLAVLALLSFGTLVVAQATHGMAGLLQRHVMGIGLGVGVMFAL